MKKESGQIDVLLGEVVKEGVVIKDHKSERPDSEAEELRNYHRLLSDIGVTSQPEPRVGTLPDDDLVREVQVKVDKEHGNELLLRGSREECLDFFENVMLVSIDKIVRANEPREDSSLAFSIDALPHNYIGDQYIDFHPVLTEENRPGDRRLDANHIWIYALVKTARIRPDFFPDFAYSLEKFLKMNKHKNALKYLLAQKWYIGYNLMKTLEQIEEEEEKEKEALAIEFNDLLFTLDPFKSRDELLGMLIVLYQFIDEDKVDHIANLLGLRIDFEKDNLIEHLSYQGKQNPRDYRKLIGRLTQIVAAPHLFTEEMLESQQERLRQAFDKMTEFGRTLSDESSLLCIGSYVRGTTNIFSDLDYVLFSDKSLVKQLIDLQEVCKITLNSTTWEDIANLHSGEVDRIKVKFSLYGIKVSILVLRSSLYEKIANGESVDIVGYRPNKASVHLLKDVRGRKHTVVNRGQQRTWEVADDGTPIVGKVVDNIVGSMPVSKENDEIVLRTLKSLLVKMRDAGVELTFKNFMSTLYRSGENSYSKAGLNLLRNRFIEAKKTVK